ncbi:helix-turn-helix domain-containing protein [Paenibacillus mesophilus]|uniref:AraC family transcriptional regulator n=1 Tax=Paenibacillus mesophilus TaxID=2582849 RepID=UPI00110F3F91|nr:AraC family transcriptional regulator [Paenibacillus mesophilus]TMV44621.1 helix-turn-helix domain-containing protein [Paenibacillus mesophilus]
MDIQVYFPNMTSTLQITGCGFNVKPPGWSYPNHHHHLFELMYSFSGEALQHVNRGTVRLETGDWLLIKSGVKHRTDNRSDSPYAFFNIHFDVDDPELRKKLSAADYGLLPRANAERTQLPGLMRQIERILTDSLTMEPRDATEAIPPGRIGPGPRIELQAYVLLIIKEIADNSPVFRVTPDHESFPVSSSMETDIAHAVEERLVRMAHSPAEHSIAEIAGQLHISRSQCTKTFTKVYGVSPRRYVSQLIESRAKFLLVTTSMSIEDIALELGFRSLSHFSRQFRRWTGLSPLQYRPKHE